MFVLGKGAHSLIAWLCRVGVVNCVVGTDSYTSTSFPPWYGTYEHRTNYFLASVVLSGPRLVFGSLSIVVSLIDMPRVSLVL